MPRSASHGGTVLKRLFTILNGARYGAVMLWLLAAAAVSDPAPPPSPRSAPMVVQATATVRIISGVRLNFGSATNEGAPAAHPSTVAANGERQPARLIEFE